MAINLSDRISEQIDEMARKYHFNQEIVQRLSFHHGFIRASSIIEALTKHPSHVSIRVNTLQTTPEKLMNSLTEKDYIVKQHPILEEALLIEVTGPFEITKKPKAIVAETKPATDVLMGENLTATGIKENHDLQIGEEVSIVDRFGTHVGNGVAMMSANEIASRKRGIAVKITDSVYKTPRMQHLVEYIRGHFIEQHIPSMLVGAQIDLKPKDRVLDLRVGHGKILTHVWQRNSKVESRIIAVSKSTAQLEIFQQTIKRLRMYKAPIEPMKVSMRGIQKKFSRDETFDWIILNPPSTDIGLRPKIAFTLNNGHFYRSNKLMKIYMYEAARLIKPGGTIFYITSSIDSAENEEIVQYAKDAKNLTLEKQEIVLGSEDITFMKAQNLQSFYPDKHDTQGYFIAKLMK